MGQVVQEQENNGRIPDNVVRMTRAVPGEDGVVRWEKYEVDLFYPPSLGGKSEPVTSVQEENT
jgi:hypothetical protein